MHRYLFLSLALGSLLLNGCATPPNREISGRLVQSASRAPIAGQQLVLDRPPGDYEAVTLPLTKVPEPVTLATATTDKKGNFAFTTAKDKQRDLRIRLAGSAPFGTYGYAVTNLRDSLAQPPRVGFDPHSMHQADGRLKPTP